MALPNVSEVRNDYTDDGYTRIDVWETGDDNEYGKTVAIVCQDTGKVFFIDNLYNTNEMVLEAIKEVTPTKAQPVQVTTSASGVFYLQKDCVPIELSEMIRRSSAFPELIKELKNMQQRLHYFAHEGELNEQDKEIVFDMHLTMLRIIESATKY